MVEYVATSSNEEADRSFNNCKQKLLILLSACTYVQWNPSKTDTIGTNDFVHCSEVSLAKGLVIDHAPPTIAANYDKARLWTTKKTVLMRVLLTDSF